MPNPKPKKSLLRTGLITFAVGFVVNAAFMLIGIGGLLRELSRLTALVGVVLIIIGLIQKALLKFKK
jgi:hypothetical protein